MASSNRSEPGRSPWPFKDKSDKGLAAPARPSATIAQEPPGLRFKLAIEKALAEGTPASGLLLQLTLRDASLLKRDNRVPREDISFSEGQMQYLGVRITEGQTASSELVILRA